MVCVSWNDAQAYVRWLAQETGAGYRLPSEAEQEWLLGGGREGERFGSGSEVSEACRYANVAGLEGAPNGGSWPGAVPCNDGSRGLSLVGRYTAPAFGLHDVLGGGLNSQVHRFHIVHRDVGRRAARASQEPFPPHGVSLRSGLANRHGFSGASFE